MADNIEEFDPTIARVWAAHERSCQIQKATDRLQQVAMAVRDPNANTTTASTAGTASTDDGDANFATTRGIWAPPVYDYELPIKSFGHLMRTYGSRYTLIFTESSVLKPYIPITQTPSLTSSLTPSLTPGLMVPWIIEAPLNSIEILEAILKPSHPFKIYTAHHFHRGCTQTPRGMVPLARTQRLHAEYSRLQGRLESDRDISFICIPRSAVSIIKERLFGVFTPVVLHYISIPWSLGGTHRALVSPWAMVLHNKPWEVDGVFHTYEDRLEGLLGKIGISDVRFKRSLLEHGTTPMPECLWDWYAGRAGTTAALPYFASTEEVERNRREFNESVQNEESHQGHAGLIASCCLPTAEGKWKKTM